MMKHVVGDGIIFQKSNIMWQKKRKSISASLYKEKLLKMTEIMKAITLETIEAWDKKGTIDIVSETANLLMTIILACAFGRKHENPIVTFRKNGVDT